MVKDEIVRDDKKWRFYVTEQLSENIAETPEGFLCCKDVPIARIGTQIYKADEVPITPNSQGLVEIKREEDEVFRDEAIKSGESKPLCIDHPDEMVTPSNWQQLAHGVVTNLRRGIREQADLLIADIVVTTKKAIELVKNGLREISLGYDADYLELAPGVGKQTNIILNHAALVDRGRAGHRCAIGDKECTNCGKCNCKNNIEEDEDAMKFKEKLKSVYRRLIKDADFEKLPDDEKADKLAEAAADQVEEEGMLEEQAPTEESVEKKLEEPMDEEPAEEPAGGGGEITNAQLMETLVKLIGIIEAFVKTASGVGDEETVPESMPTEEEAKPFINDDGGGSLAPTSLPKISGNSPIKVQATETPNIDEDPDEKEERERMEAKDCDSRWYDIAYRADLLCPGVRLSKPTKDHRAVIDRLKIKALKNAYTTDSEVVTTLVGNKKVDSLKGETLDVAFMAVSEAIKQKNNRMVKDSVVIQSGKVVSEIQGINQKNKEFWKKK